MSIDLSYDDTQQVLGDTLRQFCACLGCLIDLFGILERLLSGHSTDPSLADQGHLVHNVCSQLYLCLFDSSAGSTLSPR